MIKSYCMLSPRKIIPVVVNVLPDSMVMVSSHVKVVCFILVGILFEPFPVKYHVYILFEFSFPKSLFAFSYSFLCFKLRYWAEWIIVATLYEIEPELEASLIQSYNIHTLRSYLSQDHEGIDEFLGMP